MLSASAMAAAGCTTDIDIGGTSDVSVGDERFDAALAPDATTDAAAPLQPCDPCLAISDCVTGATCAEIGGPNGFCARLCPSGSECASGADLCQLATNVAGSQVQACVPKSGTCAPAIGPGPTADGAIVERCGDLVAPSVAGTPCHSCNPESSTCQPNGCYGGWWCNTYYRRCDRPPKYCG